MTDTGLFFVLDIDPLYDMQGNIQSVVSICVRCNSCQHVNHLKWPALRSIPGGTILACSECGKGQSVSNARLVVSIAKPAVE
ncbi:hypothetical protein FEO94_11405 [Stenotrophomonas maltophilia]|nr:hypothetical protein FEO94_11405 [Stenotrophomonas maltophilia]